jgi:hypothetical protein
MAMRTASPLRTTSRRAALPLLIGICGVATCTPEAGGGATGADGAASGGGGDGGDGLPACGDATLVRACASSASLEGDRFQVTVDGTLTRAEMADAADTCFASPDMFIGPFAPPVTPVLALRVLSEGVSWDVAMVLPGASARGWTIGDDVSLVLAGDFNNPIDGDLKYIAVERQGDLLVAALDDARNGVAVEGIDVAAVGAEECYDGDDTCGRARFEMEVTIGAESATIPTDASAVVGGLLVTNDHFFEQYEYTCCCNMGTAAYALGAVAVLAE